MGETLAKYVSEAFCLYPLHAQVIIILFSYSAARAKDFAVLFLVTCKAEQHQRGAAQSQRKNILLSL